MFFREIGCGRIGSSNYMIYDLLGPDKVYDPETAARLDGVFLIGDDFAGNNEAYDRRKSWKFGGIGGNGRFSPHRQYATFIDFIEDWFGKPE
jgi:hypothetical protein